MMFLVKLSKEHYKKLKTFLSQLETDAQIPTTNIVSHSFIQTGNIEILSASKDYLSSAWIINSGATDHMISHSKFFSTYTILSGKPKVKVVDGTFSLIIGQGIASITPFLTLKYVLHDPKLSCNLLSARKFTKDLNCVTYAYSHCIFQDRIIRRRIGHGERKGRLYYLITTWKIGASIPQAFATTNNPSKVDPIWLWQQW